MPFEISKTTWHRPRGYTTRKGKTLPPQYTHIYTPPAEQPQKQYNHTAPEPQTTFHCTKTITPQRPMIKSQISNFYMGIPM